MAGLPEGRCLLVAGDACDRDRMTEPLLGGMPDDAGAGHDLGQQRTRNVEQRQQGVVPAQRVNIEQHRARGIAGVGDVAAAQAPDQPAVDGAEGQLALLGPAARAGNVVEQPLQFGGGEIGVELEARAFLDEGRLARVKQAVAHAGGAPVLPHNGVGHRFAGHAVPQQRGLALVGDADRGHLRGLDAALRQRLARAGELAVPDVERVVLDPARLGEVLGEFTLAAGHRQASAVEQDGARAGRALVEGEDVLRQWRLRTVRPARNARAKRSGTTVGKARGSRASGIISKAGR